MAVDIIARSMAGSHKDQLPEVTASDNGSILAVVDGEWGKQEITHTTFGYDLVFEVTGTTPLEADVIFPTTATFESVMEAITNGNRPTTAILHNGNLTPAYIALYDSDTKLRISGSRVYNNIDNYIISNTVIIWSSTGVETPTTSMAYLTVTSS